MIQLKMDGTERLHTFGVTATIHSIALKFNLFIGNVMGASVQFKKEMVIRDRKGGWGEKASKEIEMSQKAQEKHNDFSSG